MRGERKMKIEVELNLSEKTCEVLNGLINALTGARKSPVEKNLKPAGTNTKATKEEETVTKPETTGAKAEATEPTATNPEYTEDDVRAALADAKHRIGSSDACRKLLTSMGAKKVADLKPEQYAEVITKAKAL